VQKVWKAERAHEEEQKKIKQYLKEIEEQRQIEELRKLHSETTGITRLNLDLDLYIFCASPSQRKQYFIHSRQIV
jgi:hypothetical protein